jgi:uncharacterized membrane-anchored protein
MRKLILIITAIAILIIANYSIWYREGISFGGRTVLLELAPIDPRSLMQGDFMALRFRLANEAFTHDKLKGLKDGAIVLVLDSNNIGTFRRFADGGSLASDEAIIRYHIRNGKPEFATNAFFFQEGQVDLYRYAKYGEFKVSPEGEAILIAMRDSKLQILGPKVEEKVALKNNVSARQGSEKNLNTDKKASSRTITRPKSYVAEPAVANE